VRMILHALFEETFETPDEHGAVVAAARGR
jgi:hypothetical protein